MKTREKHKYIVAGVDVDYVINEVRKVCPCNRTSIKEHALTQFLKGRSIKDIAQDISVLRSKKKLSTISEKLL